MRTPTRKIIVFVIVTLVAAGFAPGQNVAVEEVPAAVNALQREVDRRRWPIQSGRTTPVLVIPSAELEAKDLLMINEDLNVMSHIFETNLQRVRITPSARSLFIGDRSALFDVFAGRGRGTIQSLYLQGYGALFLMNVNFPLSPRLQAQQQDETEKEEDGDKVWDDARRQLYEPERVARRKTDKAPEKYDAEKVESLKTTLIEALKHAANIRNLKPAESAILTITGDGTSAGVGTITLQRDGKITTTNRIIVYDKQGGTTRMVSGNSLDDLGLSSPTVLVIRAKKADIDSFAKGDLDLEQFRRHVQIVSYPYLAAAADSGDYRKSSMFDTEDTEPAM